METTAIHLYKTLLPALLCSIAFPALWAQQPYSRIGKDHALFFAVKDYEHGESLNNPIRDAEAIAQVLEHKYGFHPTIIRNPAKEKIQLTIRQYWNKKFAHDEQLFIYFSGHGEFEPYPGNPEEGKGYFIPADGKRIEHDPTRQSYLLHKELLDDIDAIPCKHIMLVMDACKSGALIQNKSGRPGEYSSAEQFFLDVLPYKSRLLITSGGKERTPDGTYHSPLTEKLLSAFATNGGKDRVLSFFDLYSHSQQPEIRPRPRQGSFGKNDPNSDFLFLYRPPSVSGFVTDGDGNRYPILRLAGKQWLGKNLNLEIPESYCYNNDPANCAEYGRLYTFEAAKKACAALGSGWRLPFDEDWSGLLNAYGGYYDLEEGEIIGDPESSYSALFESGSSGFSALLGGYRYSDGEYVSLGQSGFYWSATGSGAGNAWLYYFNGVDRWVSRLYYSRALGFSCRCLKD